MGRIEKTVFISYRHENKYIALAIYQDLRAYDYDVFVDYESINSGDFEQIIIENIKSHAHFIVVLTPSSLDRCDEPRDWLRREIETAMEYKRNIVPIVMEGFKFSDSNINKHLTGKLKLLKKYQYLEVPMNIQYFKYAMMDLRDRFLNIELDAVLHPSSLLAQRVATEQTIAADNNRPIEQKELTAQEWFERGYVFQEAKNLDEAIRCYSESLRLDPNFDAPYNNLGNVFASLERYGEAEIAHRKAIELNPSYIAAYTNLGNVLESMKRYEEAKAAHCKAIDLDPSSATAYSNLGNVLKDLKRYEEAEAAYRKAIDLNPLYAAAHYNLGSLLKDLKRYEEAEVTYRKVIDIDPSLPEAYYNLVLLLRLTNRSEDALPLLREVIEIDPGDFNPYLALASINKQLGKGASAEYLAKARQLLPESDWYNNVCLESVCGDFDLAFEHLQKAAQLDDFNPAWAWEDPDLQWIRNDPRFAKIVGPKPE